MYVRQVYGWLVCVMFSWRRLLSQFIRDPNVGVAQSIRNLTARKTNGSAVFFRSERPFLFPPFRRLACVHQGLIALTVY